MTLVPARNAPRVLVLCDDPMESQLLRSLLRALPEPRPELVFADPDSSPVPATANQCDCCFLSFSYAGLPLGTMLSRLRAGAPQLRVIGLLSTHSRLGDRHDVVQALRGGVTEIVLLEELSVATLAPLLGGTGAAAPRQEQAQPPAAATIPGAPVQTPPDEMPATGGSWRIALNDQRAGFDAATLHGLGYAPQDVGSGLGDWKSLIHPDDVDRLVAEVHGVLSGSAPPHPVTYRLRRSDGVWLPVVSDDIAVEFDDNGAPRSISGRFYAAGSGAAPERAIESRGPAAPPDAAADAVAQEMLAQLDVGLMRLQRDAGGAFRVQWCNEAAAALEQRAVAELAGLRVAEFSPKFDSFDLEESLERVYRTGITESHEIMALGRGEQPHWRCCHLRRLACGELLIEASDISESVGSRASRRMQDEMAQFIVRALPITTMLVDEQGRVVQGIAAAAGVLASQPSGLEDRTLRELLGDAAGAECLLQVQKTLNTGRIATATYAVPSDVGQQWLECCSSAVRGRPGMPQRALLTVQDTTERVRELGDARMARDQAVVALRRVPVPLFLKDVDGRYLAINPAFGALFGVEETMLLGKTDLEVFPDDLAMELHETDRKLIETGVAFSERRVAGQGECRGEHYCFCFPVGVPGGPVTGTGGILIAAADLGRADPLPATPREADGTEAATHDGIEQATASVVSRVEQVLAEAGDYEEVLRRLEQLVETTMHAQALIHEVAGQIDAATIQPMVALTPLAQNIVELERILLPPGARLENDIEGALPPAQCNPLVFHQILLRGIRHARRKLGHNDTLRIRLRLGSPGQRACVSCREGFDGNYVELVIEDFHSKLSESDIRGLTDSPTRHPAAGGALDDLAEIHALVHAQGGHLQIQQGLPAGTSVHVFFRAANPELRDERLFKPRSTVTRFPFTRAREPRDSN